jgi:hypothetical protein
MWFDELILGWVTLCVVLEWCVFGYTTWGWE